MSKRRDNKGRILRSCESQGVIRDGSKRQIKRLAGINRGVIQKAKSCQ